MANTDKWIIATSSCNQDLNICRRVPSASLGYYAQKRLAYLKETPCHRPSKSPVVICHWRGFGDQALLTRVTMSAGSRHVCAGFGFLLHGEYIEIRFSTLVRMFCMLFCGSNRSFLCLIRPVTPNGSTRYIRELDQRHWATKEPGLRKRL